MNVEERVRRSLRQQAEHAGASLPALGSVLARTRRRRHRRIVAVGAAVLLAAGGVTAAYSTWGTSSVRLAGQPAQGDAPGLGSEEFGDHEWRALPSGPIDAWADVAAVWTGQEVLFGRGGEAPAAAAYDPRTGGWRKLADGPARGEGHVAVWTGREMIVWGGRGGTAHGALYDPDTNEWRRTADAPVAPTARPAAVWTGEEMIVWGGTTGGGLIPAEASGAAYDPDTDRWRALPPSPVEARRNATAVWTGKEIIVWGGQGADNRPVPTGAAYDPERDSWRTLPAAPARGFFRHSAVWTGRTMLVWGWVHGTAGQDNETIAYDPVSDTWDRLPAAPLDPPAPGEGVGGQAAVWAGGVMLAWSGTLDAAGPLALALDPATGRWTRLSGAPTPAWYHPTVVWTGSAMVVWGGAGGAVLWFGPPGAGTGG